MERKVNWRMPAEWEEQWGVQLTWPHEATDWREMLGEIEATYVEMAIEIAKRERLIIVAPQPEKVREQIALKAGQQLADSIMMMACDTNDTGARDHGFIALMDEQGKIRLLDFKFNGWGEKFMADKDNAINRQLFDQGMVEGEYLSHLDFVLEGGAIESDGKGVVMTTTHCLMAPHRNQPLTKDEIEQQLKERLKATQVLWIDHGNLVGDDTDGHIDTLVRMAPNNTLLYIGPGEEGDEQYEELARMKQQLAQLTRPDGHHYRLIELPMPNAIYDEGERLPATYANFLVMNGAVLCPTYGQREKDELAMKLIAQAFPGREIVGIDCRSVIRQHGSLHCCTMQYYPNEAGTEE